MCANVESAKGRDREITLGTCGNKKTPGGAGGLLGEACEP
jgi:hypothetical protein